MAFSNSRKFTAIVVTATMLTGTFLTGFTYQNGIGNVYYETKSEIFDDTYYSTQMAGHSTNGIERAFFVNTDTEDSDLQPFVFEGEVTGTYTMNTMISTLESQGYKVVAGINGDLYDTASGTPKGLTIHDGKIKTSGYAPEYDISFDQDGKASLQKVNLGYSLKGTINVPTTVTVPSADPATTDPAGTQTTDPSATGTDPAAAQTTDPAITQTVNPTAPQQAQPPVTTTEYVPTDWTAPIGFFNVPHGGAKALHLYNRQYASTTKTKENSVEVILQADSAWDAEPAVGGTIEATVVEVRNGTSNTPIGDSQLVLSAAMDSPYAPPLSYLAPGSTVEISVDDWGGTGLANSKEAIGVYYVMCDGGQVLSNGTNVNPRTAIGIKPDGTVMLYALDGRQPGYSGGLGLTDMMKHMMDLGCTTVVNMDGGGSTVMAVREAGIDSKAVAKTSPSEGTQRKTTNGLLLVYKGSGGSSAEHLHTYASEPLAMPGADIQLSTYASNDYYEPASLPGSVSYSVDGDSDSTVDDNGLFTAGGRGLETAVQIDIQNNITFTTNVQNLVIDPGKTSDVNVNAKFGYAPIASKDSLFTFTCDPVIGTIDENGLFQAVGAGGVSGNIYVEYNGVTQTIPVQVGASMIDFKDTASHWAREYIGKLAARGVVNGMGDNYYQPDASLTRAQFLTMLAKTIYGLDPSQSAPAGFTDVPATEWYYNYVNWGYASGIVNGMDETTFAPDSNITREQMAIMLSNFARYTELVLPETGATANFTDSSMISDWSAEAVNKIVSSGVMGGYPEGNFIPQGKATRAEAAAVVYKVILIRDNIAKAKK
ncbi:MAG TPA: S-layer homology domain-containing protein [Bacillota bacterium]|nr:S-layer homology domain-containing protein [Bacillota bacterium]